MHTLVSRAVRFHEKGAPERTQALRAAAVEALRQKSPKRRWTRGCTSRLSFAWRTHVRWSQHRRPFPRPILWAGWRDMTWNGGRMRRHERCTNVELEFRRRVQGPEHRISSPR